MQMVAAGMGLTLLPALCAPMERTRASLVLRPFAPPVPGRQLVLAWRGGSPLAGALATFAGELRAAWPGAISL
jgi:LysR family hydrogen peroxide-inducible transcriptional activator